jgi:ABC-type sugar transport system ATPase subunit
MPPILKIRGITKSYPGVRALQDVSFDVERGSIHAIMGENGAGKSTLMQIIAGAQRPDSGTLEFDGREVHFASPAEAQAIGIAIVYQELNLSPNLSIAENVFLGLEPRAAGVFVDAKR